MSLRFGGRALRSALALFLTVWTARASAAECLVGVSRSDGTARILSVDPATGDTSREVSLAFDLTGVVGLAVNGRLLAFVSIGRVHLVNLDTGQVHATTIPGGVIGGSGAIVLAQPEGGGARWFPDLDALLAGTAPPRPTASWTGASVAVEGDLTVAASDRGHIVVGAIPDLPVPSSGFQPDWWPTSWSKDGVSGSRSTDLVIVGGGAIQVWPGRVEGLAGPVRGSSLVGGVLHLLDAGVPDLEIAPAVRTFDLRTLKALASRSLSTSPGERVRGLACR